MSECTKSKSSSAPGHVYTVSVTDLSNLGFGVGRLPAGNGPKNGLVVFIKGAVTGDTVETALIKCTRPMPSVGFCG